MSHNLFLHQALQFMSGNLRAFLGLISDTSEQYPLASPSEPDLFLFPVDPHRAMLFKPICS